MLDWLMRCISEGLAASEQEEADAYRRWRDGKPRRIIDPTTMSDKDFRRAIHDLRNQTKNQG